MRKRKQYTKSRVGGYSHLPTLIVMIVALVLILWGGKYLSQMVAEGFVPDVPVLDKVALEDETEVTNETMPNPEQTTDISDEGLLSRQLSRAFKRRSLELLDMIAKGQNP